MSEEFGRWLDAARAPMPVSLAALGLFLAGVLLAAWLFRGRLSEARRLEREAKASEKRAEHLHAKVDRIVEPTQALDMSVLTAHPDKAKFNPRNVLVRMRERRKVGEEFVPPAEWTADELAAVKAMNDRSGWPNTTYQPRGWLPRLRRQRDVPVIAVTPKEIGERIKKIRDEKKAVAK